MVKIKDDQLEVRWVWVADFAIDPRECHDRPCSQGVGVATAKVEELLEITNDARLGAPRGIFVSQDGVARNKFAVGGDREDQGGNGA